MAGAALPANPEKGAARPVGGDAPAAAAWASYLALVPLAVGVGMLAARRLDLGGAVDPAWLPAYGAVLVTFLAGIRWGQGMRRTGIAGAAALAGIAPLAAWPALLLPPSAAYALLAAALAGQGAWDRWAADRGSAPEWYGRLRVRATLPAVGLMILAVLLASF